MSGGEAGKEIGIPKRKREGERKKERAGLINLMFVM